MSAPPAGGSEAMAAGAKQAELFERAYRRFLDGAPAELLGLLSEEVTYHLPGLHLGGGTLRGKSDLAVRLASAVQSCSVPPHSELLSMASGGDLIVTLEHIRAEARSGSLDQNACVVWRFASGSCVEIWSHFEDQAGCDDFWRGVLP